MLIVYICKKNNYMRKLSNLNESHYKLLNALPDTFTASLAANTCESLGFNKRWFESCLRKKNFSSLFIKSFHGVYRKK